jgi:hypothetical protein
MGWLLGSNLLRARQIEKRGEGLGPDSVQERKSLFFYPKVFSIFVLQIHFAVLETI